MPIVCTVRYVSLAAGGCESRCPIAGVPCHRATTRWYTWIRYMLGRESESLPAARSQSGGWREAYDAKGWKRWRQQLAPPALKPGNEEVWKRPVHTSQWAHPSSIANNRELCGGDAA